MLRVTNLNGKPIKSVCGTTLMHPAATRSIRIADTALDANLVMRDVFDQYATLIGSRTDRVRGSHPLGRTDMRVGWLLWEDELKEFLYFEEEMVKPDSDVYYAEWNETAARGARKGSKSLWIYEKNSNKKRYSVTTSAGIKIQPYILMFRRPVIQICSIFARKVSGLIVIRSFFGYHPRLRCNYTKDWDL